MTQVFLIKIGLTKEIAEAIDKILLPQGVGVVIEATHMVRQIFSLLILI